MSYMAIITYSSRGIGTATARLAAETSYVVCLNYVLDADAARKIAIQCESKGQRASAVQADVTDSADVPRLFHACDERLAKSASGSGAVIRNNSSVAAGNPDRPATVTANAPLRRLAMLEYIATDIVWLASAPADYVNGAVLPVSDGL